MTTTTSSDLAALRARMAPALSDRLPAHIDRLDWRPDQLAEFQRASLRALLHRAVEHSPFHAGRLAAAGLTRADIDTFELSDLAKLPIMTKTQMMTNFDAVVTDRRLTRALVERYVTDSVSEPSLILGDYVCLASGGSSGLRGTYIQTPEEYAEFGVSVTRRAVAAFLAFGGQLADGVVSAVPEGTTSSRVLLTNLHNRTQPLIRYELTDRFTPAGLSAAGFLRATVDGRADEGFRYGDLTVHPSVLTTPLLQTAAVREYQVRQTSRGVTVAVMADTAFDRGALAEGIERNLRQAGLTEPEVEISYVDAIARDPLTGKAKRFVPNRAATADRAGTGQPT